MGRRITLVALASLVGLASACGGKAVTVPESPPPHLEEPRTRVDPGAEDTGADEESAPLVAPPPAYGNKVVLARRGAIGAF